MTVTLLPQTVPVGRPLVGICTGPEGHEHVQATGTRPPVRCIVAWCGAVIEWKGTTRGR